MTDWFWFHICWNVESVTWPLWYRVIYRALTPVANVSGEGTGRPALQVDSVHQTTFRATTKRIAFPRTSFLTYYFCTACWVVVVKCQAAFLLDWERPGKTACSRRLQTDSVIKLLLVQTDHVPIRRGLRQIQAREKKKKTKLSEGPCQSALHYKIRLVGVTVLWGIIISLN